MMNAMMNLSAAQHAVAIDNLFRRRSAVRVAPAMRRAAASSLVQRLRRSREPSTFHRFLAVHMHFAEHSGALHRDDIAQRDEL